MREFFLSNTSMPSPWMILVQHWLLLLYCNVVQERICCFLNRAWDDTLYKNLSTGAKQNWSWIHLIIFDNPRIVHHNFISHFTRQFPILQTLCKTPLIPLYMCKIKRKRSLKCATKHSLSVCNRRIILLYCDL